MGERLIDQRLITAFRRLVAAHDAAGSPLSALLRPPVQPARLDEAEERLGFPLSPTVRTLFRIADGVSSMRYPGGSYGEVLLGNSWHWFAPLARAVPP